MTRQLPLTNGEAAPFRRAHGVGDEGRWAMTSLSLHQRVRVTICEGDDGEPVFLGGALGSDVAELAAALPEFAAAGVFRREWPEVMP